MPKRSERDKYSEAFEGNPFKGKSPRAVYKALQWGNNPRDMFDIEAPEPLVALGEVAKIVLQGGHKESISEKDAPFLALGTDSNNLYIIQRDENGEPVDVPLDLEDYDLVGKVKSTHYYSNKGNEKAYYYHDHEKPYPLLYRHEASGVCVLIPQDNNGSPSYAVAIEGIIG